MARYYLLGAGAGLVSAALFASAATGTALAGILFYLAPLPICLAGLGWGGTIAAVAALAGTLFAGIALGLGAGAIFGGAIALPLTVLCYLALLSRPAAAAQSGQSTLEWYPIGRLVGWAAIIAGALAGIMVLMLGYAAHRFTNESLRIEPSYGGGLTLSQWASVIVVAAAVVMELYLWRTMPSRWKGEPQYVPVPAGEAGTPRPEPKP